MRMTNFQAADILHFKKYYFTDTGESASHFALTLLPAILTSFENNLYCAVITSKRPKNNYNLLLKKEEYKCFSLDSFVCFDRIDINCVDDLSEKRQPVGRLNEKDTKEGYEIFKKSLFTILKGDFDEYLVATFIREWKRIR